MDFLKILKSFEEFVYEALSWFVLLPKTLVQIIVRPLRMSAYAAIELERDDEARFDTAVSPPLLLILCVLIANLVDLAIDHQKTQVSAMASPIFASEQNLLLYRTLAFGIWPLVGALYLLLQTRAVVGRSSMRSPFYQQCYLVAPFALAFSIGLSMTRAGANEAITACIVLTGYLWFWLVQIAWVRRNAHLSLPISVLAATGILVAGSLVNALVGYVILHGHV